MNLTTESRAAAVVGGEGRSCKRRGFCPSCGARRMAQTSSHLIDHVIPHVPVRQWVLSLPIPLRLMAETGFVAPQQ